MAVIAKSSITLTSVNDGYSIMLTPNSCVVNSDFDGTNLNLDNAKASVSVMCGDKKLAISDCQYSPSDANITYRETKQDDYVRVLAITNIGNGIREGYIDITITVQDGAIFTTKFTFSVVRESTMLDWIQDWDSNKTTLGDTYVITPRLFVGKKIIGSYSDISDVKELTGVYIGPDSDTTAGIYGYQSGADVFHINSTEAFIGGWNISQTGIYASNDYGVLKILSEGSLSFKNKEDKTVWEIATDGSASFAQGNVKFGKDGNAFFDGQISAISGKIAGWVLSNSSLSNTCVRLDSASRLIGICAADQIVTDGGQFKTNIQTYGGVYMYFTSKTDYGFQTYTGNQLTFSAGVSNKIAGWSFDDSALWLGNKNNNDNQYTTCDGDITIGTKGLRGKSWYINTNGTSSFVGGYVTFNSTDGKIAGWAFDNNSLYIGTKNDTSNEYTTASGSLTFGSTGIRGYKWRLENDGASAFCGGNIMFNADGSGNIAKGNLSWDVDGNVTFSDAVRVNWKDEISIAQRMAYAKILYRDPEFVGDDFNGTFVYPGSDNTIGTREIYVDDAAPNSTQRTMKITASSWASDDDHRLLGFRFSNESRAGAEFVVRIVAKIPIGLQINNYHNSYGKGGTAEWLTSQLGTGKYEEYLCHIKCGTEGDFSSINHFALTDPTSTISSVDNIVWYVAYATVFDISSSDKLTTAIDVNGIYTGTLRADQIVTGTISSSLINADELLSNGNAWALKQDGSGYLANKGIVWDKNGSLSIIGTINATDGTIGGFKLDGKDSSGTYCSLVNTGFDSNAYIIIRDDSQSRFAGIGNINSGTTSCVAKFGNTYTPENDAVTNVGIILSVQNAYKNTALSIDGGCVTGLALGTRMVQTTPCTLKLSDTIAIANSSKIKDEMVFVLPDMRWCDDGHIVKLAATQLASGYTFTVKPGKGTDNSGAIYNTLIRYDGANYDATSKIFSATRCVTLVYYAAAAYADASGNILGKGVWFVVDGM